MNVLIIISCANKKEAEKIAQAAIKKKLAACANIIEGVSSKFWWQGKIDNANEILIFLKTKRLLFKKIAKLVKSMHSYDVPEIIALPIIAGERDYLRWLSECTTYRTK
ncbi:MAG: divalent-cation tolerance protein CutA [Candidatus Omnitrophota bacterium]|nr:divalent-cation tolerance protein CutA [Candidatus Omnitrophota bacterium]